MSKQHLHRLALKSRSHLLSLSIAHALAQSTLLAHYETLANHVLSHPSTTQIPKELATTGSIHLTRREATKLSGEFVYFLPFNIHSSEEQGSYLLSELQSISSPTCLTSRNFFGVRPVSKVCTTRSESIWRLVPECMF